MRLECPSVNNWHWSPVTSECDKLSFSFSLEECIGGFNHLEMLEHIKRYIFMGHVGEYISVSEVYCTNNFHSPPHHTSSILSAFWLPTRTCCCLRRAIVLNLGIKRSSNCEVFWWWRVWILSGHTFRGSLASWCHSATLGMRYTEFVYLYLCICVFVWCLRTCQGTDLIAPLCHSVNAEVRWGAPWTPQGMLSPHSHFLTSSLSLFHFHFLTKTF